MAENQEALLKEKRKGLTKDKILLEWSNINYTITLKKTNNTKVSPILVPPESGDSSKNLEDENKRVILNNISGFALPNEVLAILGPSGSGKTSLLNIIACRQLNTNKTATITRNVKANNIQMDVSNFGRICAYIMQDDILMESLTPRESLYFGARLKLTLDEGQIKKKVEKIISRFGLEKCADSRIGNIESKGISGGERKRTSIAYEVISDPPIIIIDEPTTGMDSFTSLVIVKYLKSLAHLGKTIICTIHQPSSEIFNYIDRLVLLKDGKLVYQGKSEDSLKYLASINLPLPEFCNPFDYFLKILSDPNLTASNLNDNYLKLCESEVQEENIKFHEEYKTKEIYTFKENLRQVSWFLEFWLLLKRTCTNYIRSKTLFFTRMLNALFNTLIIMGFYWNIGSEDKKDQLFQNYIGFFFNNVNQFFINGIYTSIFMIPTLKTVLKREYSAKLYRISTFYSSLALSLLINSFLYAIIFCPVTFFTLNLIFETALDNLNVFSIYFLLNFFIFSLGQFFGLLIGGSLPEAAGYVVTPFMFIIFMLGAGIYRGNQSLPQFVAWFLYISPYKYLLELTMKNFMNFNQITEKIPDLMDYNYGNEVCIPTLIGTMMTVLIIGYFGIKNYAAKF